MSIISEYRKKQNQKKVRQAISSTTRNKALLEQEKARTHIFQEQLRIQKSLEAQRKKNESLKRQIRGNQTSLIQGIMKVGNRIDKFIDGKPAATRKPARKRR